MSRCKACDAVLEPHEIIWYPDRGEHETCCYKCRNALYEDMDEDELGILIDIELGNKEDL